MSSSCSFSEHINRTCKKARDMCSWILRTFSSRSPLLMITLWKSLVQPILDYCSQLWCHIQLGQIKQLEEIQKSFTRKIKLDQKLNYWERLKVLRLYSQERRRERAFLVSSFIIANHKGFQARHRYSKRPSSFSFSMCVTFFSFSRWSDQLDFHQFHCFTKWDAVDFDWLAHSLLVQFSRVGTWYLRYFKRLRGDSSGWDSDGHTF